MVRIVIDEVLREKLKGMTEIVELCDEQGQVVGRVVPKDFPFSVGMECPLSPEELADRIKNPGKLYTPEQVTAFLENR